LPRESIDMIEPSCPALVIFDDDAFRRSLIKTLDEKHFTVTFSPDGEGLVKMLDEERRAFHVIVVGLDVAKKTGTKALEYLASHREKFRCGVIIVGEPSPEVRTFAPWVDETLLRPVDPEYVANRARTYCNC
jgi:ActR/RegA family two-component response regulator